MSTLERFADHLRAVDDRNTFDNESGVITVFGEGSDRNAQFAVTEQALNAHLGTLEESAHLVWPETDTETATFRLLSVHLMERVESGSSSLYALDENGLHNDQRP